MYNPSVSSVHIPQCSSFSNHHICLHYGPFALLVNGQPAVAVFGKCPIIIFLRGDVERGLVQYLMLEDWLGFML